MFGKTDRTLRLVALLVMAPLSLGLAACSDDKKAATGTTASSASSAGGGDVKEYCDATLAIETVPEPDIDFESLSPEQQKEAAKKFAADELVDRANAVTKAAPAELAADVAVLVGAVDTIAKTGDFNAFEAPDVQAASDRVHAFDLKNCGWGQADVTGFDYTYEGVRASYEAGPVSFEFANKGKELHEIILLKKKADTTESFDALLALPQEQAQAKVDTAGSTFAAPGDGDFFVADLEKGAYLVVCFIPVGLTPEVADAAEKGGPEPDGPPHFTQGMKAEFSVN